MDRPGEVGGCLVFRFGAAGCGEDIQEDSQHVADEETGAAKGNHRLNRAEPQPVAERQSRGKTECAEYKRYE